MRMSNEHEDEHEDEDDDDEDEGEHEDEAGTVAGLPMGLLGSPSCLPPQINPKSGMYHDQYYVDYHGELTRYIKVYLTYI